MRLTVDYFTTVETVCYVLPGCHAMRQLEAAKFLWIDAMETISKETVSIPERLLQGRSMLLRAFEVMDGRAWGADRGEIYLALATADIAMWAVMAKDEEKERELLLEADAALTASRQY